MTLFRHARYRRKGFTLVELLVVIGVIAVLIAMLMPAMQRARKSAQAIQCQSNIRQILSALYLYEMNRPGGAVPPQCYKPTLSVYWAVPLDRFLGGQDETFSGGEVLAKVFMCPSMDLDPVWISPNGGVTTQCISYAFNFMLRNPNPGPHYKLSQIKRPADKFIIWERSDLALGPTGIQSPWQFQPFSGMCDASYIPTPQTLRHRPLVHLGCVDGHVDARHYTDRAVASQMLPPPADVYIEFDKHWGAK